MFLPKMAPKTIIFCVSTMVHSVVYDLVYNPFPINEPFTLFLLILKTQLSAKLKITTLPLVHYLETHTVILSTKL